MADASTLAPAGKRRAAGHACRRCRRCAHPAGMPVCLPSPPPRPAPPPVSCSVGGAAFCLDTSRAYVSTRQQFGSPVASFQATQFRLADMATQLAASRLMVRHAAAALDARAPDATLQCAMAKRFATDACYALTNDALQLLGGYGCGGRRVAGACRAAWLPTAPPRRSQPTPAPGTHNHHPHQPPPSPAPQLPAGLSH